jgi:hypothetical protein
VRTHCSCTLKEEKKRLIKGEGKKGNIKKVKTNKTKIEKVNMKNGKIGREENGLRERKRKWWEGEGIGKEEKVEKGNERERKRA